MTLLLGFAAVNTGNNLLYLLVSALLGFMAVSGILGRWNLARLELRCVPPDEVYDGVPTLLGIELVNRRRWLPVCLLEVLLDGEGVLFPLVEPGASQRKPLPATLHGRGLHPLPPLQVRSRFPINFFVRRMTLAVAVPVLVFPVPQPCPGEFAAGPAAARGSRPLRQRGGDGEISRIGEYRGGEPLKLIHWKLSARHDQLKVKELSATARPPVILDLAELPGAGLEERLRGASWLVGRLLRDGRPVGLRAGTQVIPPACGRPHKLRLLKALALYDRGQDAA
ncbi:MAG: DUF58 domain-containing protein [Deltaproteobacteria bacterium]|nr:MAG: DUF58 domain-containing protein [Deltaproteobacteria bacterium]